VSNSRDVAEELTLTRKQVNLGRLVWIENRRINAARSGPGYLRYTDPLAVRLVGNVVKQTLDAGCEWVDIERAIVITAADPKGTPRRIFDTALDEMAARENNERRARIAEAQQKYEGPPLPRLRRMP
jgi:hypothetical protein